MSFTENIYLQKQLKLLQEENKKLRNILLEYEVDYMANKELPPFDPERPSERLLSIGERAADRLHSIATGLYDTGILETRLPHPMELDPLELVQYGDQLRDVLPSVLHHPVETFISQILLHHPMANLDLQNYGGVGNELGYADIKRSPASNYARMQQPPPPPPKRRPPRRPI